MSPRKRASAIYRLDEEQVDSAGTPYRLALYPVLDDVAHRLWSRVLGQARQGILDEGLHCRINSGTGEYQHRPEEILILVTSPPLRRKPAGSPALGTKRLHRIEGFLRAVVCQRQVSLGPVGALVIRLLMER